MAEKKTLLYALNRDSCPKNDAILYQGSCKNCSYYKRFEVIDGIQCVECSFIRDNSTGSAATRAKNKYNSAKYDSLRIVVPKGKKEVIKQYATAHNKSLNGFVNEAIDNAMQSDTIE